MCASNLEIRVTRAWFSSVPVLRTWIYSGHGLAWNKQLSCFKIPFLDSFGMDDCFGIFFEPLEFRATSTFESDLAITIELWLQTIWGSC